MWSQITVGPVQLPSGIQKNGKTSTIMIELNNLGQDGRVETALWPDVYYNIH